MTKNIKKILIKTVPYVLVGLIATNIGEAMRLSTGKDASEKMLSFFTDGLGAAFTNMMPSFHPFDLFMGIVIGGLLWLIVYLKGKNAKKYRHGEEYGSARWGGEKDIEPYVDPEFANNVILTKTERLTMESRPKEPKYARNKNVLVVGGSGSGKTRFFIKPNLLQMHSSYVVTDPKGQLLGETGNALIKNGYRIKVLNTINFNKSMHYNPFMYIHSEKDILKLVTAIMANTKGEGKGNDPFWEKAETLLYTALIGYIHYEAPKEEQNFATMLEFINAFEVREDDEDFQNAVDRMFERLKRKNPNHFAVRQYVPIENDGGDRAFYSPHEDMIHLPTPQSFNSEYAYNATALHELSHSTGHPTRLNRPQGGFFGSEQYAYEELVAEMCSCFMGVELSAEATPEHIDNHKAYVQSWIEAIHDKPDSLIRAIKDAEAAANYMDLQAGLITEQEYEKTCEGTMEVTIGKTKSIER